MSCPQIADILADVKALSTVEEWQRRQLLQRIELACEALKGQRVETDAGPWSVSEDGRTLSSDNFTHDVQLKVTGDFYSDEQRLAYSKALAERLNGVKPLPLGLPQEPPAGLLHSMAMRYRHDFGLTPDDSSPMSCGCTDAERQAILRVMRQLYEEVSGHGFFKWQE